MTTIGVLVVDDEPLARKRLVRLINESESYGVVGEAENGLRACEACGEYNPDIVLMDIRMPAMDGLEAARLISSADEAPAVIFCTAYDDYALAAFETQAIGYLLKPVKRDKLFASLRRAQKLHRSQLNRLKADAGSKRSHLSARTHTGIRLIQVAEVRLLIAEQKYVVACFPEGELLLDDSLRELEIEFPEDFVRVHRNALVGRRYLQALERSPDGTMLLRLEGIVRRPQVSRRHQASVRRLLKDA